MIRAEAGRVGPAILREGDSDSRAPSSRHVVASSMACPAAGLARGPDPDEVPPHLRQPAHRSGSVESQVLDRPDLEAERDGSS
ncbi:hypothetical protein CDD83_3415 [Cordyceps sp. RAO-2017]|nr:hypothetical protein CDD83_3415 [Cordyceps sp. RAO-2017]